MRFKKLNRNQYEHINPKYDVYLTRSGGTWGVEAFKHKVKDNNKAYIRSDTVGSYAEGLSYAKKKYSHKKRR